MKTLLLYLLLRFHTIDLATDNSFIPCQNITSVETILSEYSGTAYIDFRDHVYTIYCSDENYIYDGQEYLKISDILLLKQ